MHLVYVWYNYTCWSKILLSPIHTPAHDLQGEITGLEILCSNLVFKFLRSLNFQALELIYCIFGMIIEFLVQNYIWYYPNPAYDLKVKFMDRN